MINVKKIVIADFRGIRNLTIDFNQDNFAICGRNGTGKSGVVDALEFGLTGSISRLSGSGTGAVSIREHAPHVNVRNNPEKAYVILTIFIPSLNKEVVIRRSVKDANLPIITPESSDILEVLDKVASHPEFTLSRRELIKYVIAAPGDRAKAVQALLRLDKVEVLRTTLQKVMNSSRKEVPLLKNDKDRSQQNLSLALQITDLSSVKLLKEVNLQRSILDLPEITLLSSNTSLKDGLTASSALISTRIPKIQAIQDIKHLQRVFDSVNLSEIKESVSDLLVSLRVLAGNPAISEGVTRANFLKSAIVLISSEMCPLCDTPWDSTALKKIIEDKLKKFDELTAKRIVLEKELEPLISNLNEIIPIIKSIQGYSGLLKKKLDVSSLKNYVSNVQSDLNKLEVFLPLPDTIKVVEDYGLVPTDVIEAIGKIETAIMEIPDSTKQDAARDYLTIGQERLEAYRDVSLRYKQAEERSELAAKIFETYATVSTEVLDSIYKEVQGDFTDYYRFINGDDEGDFEAKLTPSIGKLSFDVDFYGKGFFPPGAYHSEGHQDGMGLCLYLALMNHLLGDDFTFAVLDDVLMSVDSGHRREVCKLLKDKFPNTQFVLTTHDKVWLKYMKTAGLILSKASIFFRNWDVEHGPSEWNDRDIWAEIAEELKNDRVQIAAGLLRNYLEFISSEICQNLRASVEFHADAHFDLGDLLPQATSRFSKLLSDGVAAATSWGKTVDVALVNSIKGDFDLLVANSKINEWQTNLIIHYNEWANLEVKDFTPIVDAYHKLVSSFFCSDPACGSLLYVIPVKGPKETLRCDCGTVNINLKKK